MSGLCSYMLLLWRMSGQSLKVTATTNTSNLYCSLPGLLSSIMVYMEDTILDLCFIIGLTVSLMPSSLLHTILFP